MLPLVPGQSADPPRFQQSGTEFTFDTGVLRGKLRANKKSFGLIPVLHVPSGKELCRSMGWFGLYRVFSDGQRYGAGAWDWPSQAMLQMDGAVLIRCAPAPERPFELTAVYRWRGPAALDLEITVKPIKNLQGFEVFLASYFDAAFTNAAAYVQRSPAAANQPGFLRAEKSLGDWLMFPRDPAAVALIQDGRWKLPPNPVDWKIQPALDKPIAVRRAAGAGIAAVIMAPAQDCFAIAMPHEAEGHYSTYFSLFGRNLNAGETARARARLQLLDQPTDQQVLDAYQAYCAE